mgnify:CR=1 FL=1
MSDTDSFIEEVTEEVRRDRMYAYLKRYGWIGALAVVLIVGGAAFSEYRKAQARAQAEALGDALLAAMAEPTPAARQARLVGVEAQNPATMAVINMMTASEAIAAEDDDTAIAQLKAVSVNADAPEVYRQIAAFKLLLLQADSMDPASRRQQLEALAQPGQPLAFLAQEQIAFLDISEGDTQAAAARLQSIIQAAGVSPDLQQRALQVIVSLGETPDPENLSATGN